MSSGLMDTEPGGESTQYESIQTVTKPHEKQGGQMGEMQIQPGTAGLQQQQEEKAGRTEKTAENARYGQAISEQGFGGETTGNSGSANQDGFGATELQSDKGDTEQSRKSQGYGGGSGVGA